MTDFVCIGVPYYIGQSVPSRDEVDRIRRSGIVEELGSYWVDIQPDFDKHDNRIVAINQALVDVIHAHPDRVPLVFAGDCTTCLGMVKGLEHKEPHILWYDSHGDFNTLETTPSGFLGGMPLAWLTGRGDLRRMEAMDLEPIADARVTISDARNLDSGEKVLLEQSGIKHIKDVNDLLLENWGTTPLYIHMDTDVVDCAEMPALGYPEPGGPTTEQTAETMRHAAKHSQLTGVLFTLFNGGMEGADIALEQTLKLVRALI